MITNSISNSDPVFRYRLAAFRYHTVRGYLAMAQPPGAACSHSPLVVALHEDVVWLLGGRDTGQPFTLQYNIRLNCWQERGESVQWSHENYLHTSPFNISYCDNNVFK